MNPSAMATEAQTPENYEAEHVHEVYEEIARHFSATRYKPWPFVNSFLKSLPAGAVGLDVGCGNGKYLSVNRDIFMIGSDRSSNLVGIAAQHQPHSAVVADTLALPHGGASSGGRFDFAISIAVIHHLSTASRRQEALASLLACLREGGKALIFVWALEQKNSRRGWDAGDAQDVMVPWVMQTAHGNVSQSTERTFQRYYHLYRADELLEDVRSAGGEVLQSGYEKDNWWAVATRARSPA